MAAGSSVTRQAGGQRPDDPALDRVDLGRHVVAMGLRRVWALLK